MKSQIAAAVAAALLGASPSSSFACPGAEHSDHQGHMGKEGHGDMTKMQEMHKIMMMKHQAHERPVEGQEKTPDPKEHQEHGV